MSSFAGAGAKERSSDLGAPLIKVPHNQAERARVEQPALGLRVSDFGFRVKSLRSEVKSLGFRV